MGILENPGFFFIIFFTAYVAADSGDDFSNNLFSDLAPLLALFGERATMQFMSQATGWADNIILAMAPLGIITIIVAAIRVGGPAWLKAVIGRARENRAIVEAELMSSTSKEVCELWNGQEVVRCMGKALIVELICLQSTDDENEAPKVKIVSFAEATKGEHPVLKTSKSKICGKVYNWFGHLSCFSNDGEERGRVERNERGDKTLTSLLEPVAASIQKAAVDSPSLWRRIRLKFGHTSYPSDAGVEEGEISPSEPAAVNNPTPNPVGGKSQSQKQSKKEDSAKADHRTNNFLITRNDQIDAPNISLNSHDQLSRQELYQVAAIGVALQLGVLVFSGFVTYSLKLPKDDAPVTEYAYPCTVVGTLVLVLGVMICAHVVETSTDEKHYHPVNGEEVRVIWLQQTKTVNDQDFQSFAIFPKTKREFLTTSRRKEDADNTSMLESNPDTTASVLTSNRNTAISTPKNDRDTGSAVSAGLRTLIPLCSFIVQFIYFLKGNQDTLLAFEAGLGTFITLCGFIVQFVGLRSMHWSASIAQLVAILIMMGLKALVRRDLAKPPNYCRLPEGFELDWFALNLGNTGCAPWLDPKQEHKDEYHRPWAKDGDWALATAGDSGKYEPFRHEGGKEDSRAHRIMMIRRNIGTLADWRSPTSTDAISLARAIEIVMNALFPNHQITKENWVWELKTRFTGSVNFRLNYQKNNGWKAYADELDAALSLWLYFNEKGEKEGGQGQKGEKIERDDTWLRVKGSPAKPSLRLLGSSAPGLLKDLDWWLPVGAAGIIQLSPVDVTNVPEASHESKIKIEPHRIVGSCQIPDPGPGFNRTWERHDDNGEDSRSVLAVENYTLLKQLYAQDMLSAFMWAVATKLETPVPGNADIHHPGGNNDTNSWQSFKLQNDCLSKMTQDIMNTGLGSREDIYLCIIPPLSISNKLPQTDSIIQLAREHAKPYEQLEQWKDASNTYLWLFREVQRFPVKSDIVIKATAILVEHLRRITLAVESKGIEPGYHELQDLKSEIETELRPYPEANTSSLILNIMKLYKKQNRSWLCGLVPESTSAEKENEEDLAALNFTRSHQLAMKLRGTDADRSEIQHKSGGGEVVRG